MLPKVEAELLELQKRYFVLLDQALESTPDVFVKPSLTKAKKYYWPVFIDASGEEIDLPEVGGVYCVYNKKDVTPFYIGESESISRRVDYHFSDDADAVRSSTLKKYLQPERTSLSAMGQDLRIRYLVVPFGRNDYEEHLQIKFNSNKKERAL